ncbi:hypothetical protein NBRC116601_32060 [Cognatishimia sp. WU-CL00825]
MALLGTASAPGKSSAMAALAPAASTDNAAVLNAGAQGFAAMILGQVGQQTSLQRGDLALANPVTAKALQEALQNLGDIITRLESLAQTDGQPVEPAEVISSTFQDLAAVLEQLDTLTGGAFMTELQEKLAAFTADSTALVGQATTATDIDLNVLVNDAVATVPDVLAALVEVTLRVRSQVVEFMQNMALNANMGPNVDGAKQAAVTQGLTQQPAGVAGQAKDAATHLGAPKKAANSAQAPIVFGQSTGAQAPVTGTQNLATNAASLVLSAAQPTQSPSLEDVVLPNIAPQSLPSDIKPLSDRMMAALFAPSAKAQSTAFAALEKMVGGAIEVPRELLATPLSDTPALRIDAAQTLDSTSAQATAQARSPEAQSPRFASALIQQVRAVDLQEGVTKVELTPRGLGSIEVELKTRADGSLAVVVRAENAHVLNSLREERDLLAQVIADVGQGSVEFQEYSKNPDQGENGSGSGGNEFSDGALEATDEIEDTSQTAKIGGGQLDLMT